MQNRNNKNHVFSLGLGSAFKIIIFVPLDPNPYQILDPGRRLNTDPDPDSDLHHCSGVEVITQAHSVPRIPSTESGIGVIN